MKKLFTSLILLMVGVFLSSAYAEGSIKILGKSYTSGSGTIKSADNSAITNDGSIAYKFESSGSVTLTLTDVTVQYTGIII